ncbi:hypothetical protein [Actinophytocola sp.]|uniref:hypothetical protein n=1 Tax=Actinophytocola sp. TaxID=1872138 RepID=UPI003D6A164F
MIDGTTTADEGSGADVLGEHAIAPATDTSDTTTRPQGAPKRTILPSKNLIFTRSQSR